MRRASLLLAGLILGCPGAPATATANLVGAHDLVVVGDLIFTTSTDRDELRVLELNPPGGQVGARRPLPAPNPLQPLSIPVLRRPSSLARDTSYEDLKVIETDGGITTLALGREQGGPWVYATRAGGAEISIVGGGPASDSTQLLQAGRLQTSAAVTACAGVKTSEELSRLYFATSTADGSTLHSIVLPKAVAALKQAILGGPATRCDAVTSCASYQTCASGTCRAGQRVIGTLPGEVVVDLLVIPGITGRSVCGTPAASCLVLATRQAQGRAGRVLLFDPQTLASRELQFPGPVRQLAVHAGAVNARGVYSAPGERVFGILDEERCGSTDCGGIIAVDTFTGKVALDAAGQPMLPISTGIGLPTGLAVMASGAVTMPAPDETLPPEDRSPPAAVGVVTTSTGNFIFFDASRLWHIDLDLEKTKPTLITSADGVTRGAGLYRPDGTLNTADAGVPAWVDGPGQITLANGAWRAEVIDIVVNGFIPGLVNLAAPVDGGAWVEASPEAVARARVGDTLLFAAPDGGCSAPTTVAEVGSTSFRAAAPCAGATVAAVRAGGSAPYVVAGTLTGYLERTGPGLPFSYKGSYFQRGPGHDPNAPTLAFTMGKGDPGLTSDWRWSIEIQPRLAPLVMRLDSQTIGCSVNVASSVGWHLDLQRVFAVFPSANAVLEVDPKTAASGVSASNGTCWR